MASDKVTIRLSKEAMQALWFLFYKPSEKITLKDAKEAIQEGFGVEVWGELRAIFEIGDNNDPR